MGVFGGRNWKGKLKKNDRRAITYIYTENERSNLKDFVAKFFKLIKK